MSEYGKYMVADDIGFVELINHTGTELDVVNAARVSLHKESDWEVDLVGDYDLVQKSLSDKDRGLIKFLMREKHGTPFEMGFMAQFRIRMPIFVAREHVRHRIGHSINEESGRYVELRPDFYIPERVREQKGKPGAYVYEDTKDLEMENMFLIDLTAHSKEAYKLYKFYIDAGVAKEQARMFLPLNLYTEMRWTVNARSLMNYLALRNHPAAQQEIREYAEGFEHFFSRIMPITYAAFVENDRVSP
jgi:thymidylate synthase (FAD)